MANTKYYIAYGSNLNIEQMRWRCPTAKVVGTAELDGYELLFKGSKTGAFLTIEPKVGSKVPVAVWTVTADDEASLDRYEGYPTFYYKKELTIDVKGIKTGKVRTVQAFVYIMHEDRKLAIPSRNYVNTCFAGYHTFKFDWEYLREAYRKSEGAN